MFKHRLGGPQPYAPVGLETEDALAASAAGGSHSASNSSVPVYQQRARVLCSYDAKDATELSLTGNEVNHFFF